VKRLLVHPVALLGALCFLVVAGCRDDASSRIQRAKDAVYAGDPHRALKEYRLALDSIDRNESPESSVLRARALKGAADVYYLELRDFVRAVEVYRELVHACPESPESLEGHIQVAEILRNHFRDLRGAISALTQAIDRNAPDSAELSYQVAKLYFELGDYNQAGLEAQKVQQRFETSAFVDDALFLQAQALAMEGRTEEALRTFEAVEERFPDSELAPFATFERGRLLSEAGQDVEAIELWVQALRRHPNPQTVQRAIVRVRRRLALVTPVAVGDRTAALERVMPTEAELAESGRRRGPRPRTSLEAMGSTREQAAGESAD
jgi:tetratricopeptide (TPR) repeat protein